MEELDEVWENPDLGVIGAIDVKGRLASQALACRDPQPEPVSRGHRKGSGCRQRECRRPQAHQDPRHYSGSYHHGQCLGSDYCQAPPLACAVCHDLSRPERILGPLVYIADMEVFPGRPCCL
jgi:hypothetical protein